MLWAFKNMLEVSSWGEYKIAGEERVIVFGDRL